MRSEQLGYHSSETEEDALILQNAGYGYRRMIPKSASALKRQRFCASLVCLVPVVLVVAAIIHTDPQCFISDGSRCEWQCKLIDSGCEWCSTGWVFPVCNRMPLHDSAVETLKKEKCSRTTDCVQCVDQNYVSPQAATTSETIAGTCGVVAGPSYVEVIVLLVLFLASMLAVLAVAMLSIPVDELEEEPYKGRFVVDDEYEGDLVTSSLLGNGRDRRASKDERGSLPPIKESETAGYMQPHDTGAGAAAGGAGEEAGAITDNPAWVQDDDPEEFARKQMLEWGFEI